MRDEIDGYRRALLCQALRRALLCQALAPSGLRHHRYTDSKVERHSKVERVELAWQALNERLLNDSLHFDSLRCTPPPPVKIVSALRQQSTPCPPRGLTTCCNEA
jgi:hypothetical protein